jgi:predicted Ser/Thr protein kinase
MASDAITPADINVAQVWLDALSRGACDEGAFLKAIQKLTERSPEAGWESLSLLDQYYRRGKITDDAFRSLKTQLGTQLLGPATDVEISIPLAQKDTSPPQVALTAAAAAAAATGASPAAAGQTVPIVTAATTGPVPIVTSRVLDTGRSGTGREVAAGDVLRGRYVIKNVLGRGGTGIVFEALDQYRLDLPDAGQRVALKVLHTGQSELLAELRREFQYLQSLSHPNIVRVHEYDRDGDTAFFTMEYLAGLPLSSVLSGRRQTKLDRAYALAIIRDVGTALCHAHSRGIVHGDLNPGNIFITDEGQVRVLDFGAAHIPSRETSMSESKQALTPTATPRYASPQLLEGQPADIRDDLYAFACVAYVLLAGKHPFGERTAVQAREQHLKPPRPHGLAGTEWQALRSGLTFDSSRRPSDVEKWLKAFELREAADRLPLLLALLRVPPPRARRLGLAPALGLVGLVLLAVAWWANENFESVARATAQAGRDMQAALASAGSSLAQLWHGAPAQPAQPTAPAEPPRAGPASGSAPTGASPAEADGSAQLQVPSARNPIHPKALTQSKAQVAPRAPSQIPVASPATNGAPSVAAASPAHAPSGPAPRTRIELAADTIEVPLTDPAARVVVKRTGNLHGEVSFSWWTESGTAKPGQDFVPVSPREEHIEDGKGALNLFIPVVGDATRRQAKSFYVVINEPSPGVSLGSRTLAMVTIPASE